MKVQVIATMLTIVATVGCKASSTEKAVTADAAPAKALLDTAPEHPANAKASPKINVARMGLPFSLCREA